MSRPNGTNSARVISVIETKAVRGDGTANDPCRSITQYWDFDGNLLAENDPYIKEKSSFYKEVRKMNKGVLEAVDNLIIELCKEVSRRKNTINGTPELITALAGLLRARAVNNLINSEKSTATEEELTLLNNRRKNLDELKDKGFL